MRQRWKTLHYITDLTCHRRYCFTSKSFARSITYSQHPTLRDDSGRLLSRVSGPCSTPLNTDTLATFWTNLVKSHGDKMSLIVRHEPSNQHDRASSSTSRSLGDTSSQECIRWTYNQMDSHVRSLVRGMRRLGVAKGDRVAVLMMNNSAMASLQIATSFIGAILVTLNLSYRPKELLQSLIHAGASILFIVPSLRSSDYIENLQSILPSLKGKNSSRGDATILYDEECPSLKRIILVDNLSNRPKGWEAQSLLAQGGRGFTHAIDRMNGKVIDYREILQEQDGNEVNGNEEANLTCQDVINLQFTSGTTGKPKAVALSSHNLINNAILLGQVMGLKGGIDILANIPPLFHCFGLTLGNLATISTGSTLVYSSEGFDAIRALRATSEEQATALHGVPAHFIAELSILRQLKEAQKSKQWDHLEKLGIKRGAEWSFNVRTGFTSGSTVPIELMRSIMSDDLLGAKEQTTVYGMTETSPVSFACDTKANVRLRCETVGRVIPHAHAKVVSPDDPLGKPLPIGEIGELCTAGYIVMKGYWNDEEKTNEVLQIHPDEPEITWMRTGDLAVLDEQGYAKIRGRVKDLIIRGGENLTAVNIENCIDTLPGVASSAAIAVPDENMGEAVGVFISKQKTEKQAASTLSPITVRAHVKEHLSGQCAPDWVWFLDEEGVPKEWPTTASGKVQKVILRQWAKELAEKDIGRAKTSMA